MRVDHQNIGDVLEHVYFTATVTGVDGSNDTVNFDGIALCPNGEDIPLFYHCAPDSELRDNGALEGAAGAFSAGDEVIVQCEILSAENYNPLRVIGFTDKPKPCAPSNCYVYVTISDYVTIWDLETGEVAENICNNDGEIYDDAGNPLMTFPCHKDDLVRWLEGVKGRPTRQVLKDEPEHNRDYLFDNGLDIGNENRLELCNEEDPSYDYYYGIQKPAIFTVTVRDETLNECYPYCCYEYGCVVSPLEECNTDHVKEKNTSHSDTIKGGCDPEKCAESFSCLWDKTHFYDCAMHLHTAPYRNCRVCNRSVTQQNVMEYSETCFSRTKHLYLCPYPSPTYWNLAIKKYVEFTTPQCSLYKDPIDIETDCTFFNCVNCLDYPDLWPLRKVRKQGNSLSVRTKFGYLILDYIPKREWEEDNKMLYEIMREATLENRCFSTYLREGVCDYASEWEATLDLWRNYNHPPGVIDGPEHATNTENWCKKETRSILDQFWSESNRTGITWCGSPNSQVITNWYRVLLRFHMGGFHTGGSECLQNWDGSPEYCPDEWTCKDLIEKHPWVKCNATDWNNKLIERFSSVQATIELQNPQNYPKKNTSAPGNPGWGKRYKRPEDYSGLCASPSGACGYPEDEENNICYPFDGTYDIYTLGEAIEELINDHYEDGSDDKLLVYYLKH